MRYDWDKGNCGQVNRFMSWGVPLAAFVVCALSLRAAAAMADWTLAIPALLFAAFAAGHRLMLHALYGVRGPSRAGRPEFRAEDCWAVKLPDGRLAVWDYRLHREVPPRSRIVPAGSGGAMPSVLPGIRLAAASASCAHHGAEPVDLVTGERVGWVCPDCDGELPAGWR